MDAPRRNVELKASDPDPDAHARARARRRRRGPRACCASATRTSASRAGGSSCARRSPGGATLIAYERPDEARERVSPTGSSPVADAGGAARGARRGAWASRAVVEKRRRLLLWESVRIHLDDVEGLGAFVELEAVAEPGSDLAREQRAGRAGCARCSGSATTRCSTGSYADAVRAGRRRARPTPSCSRWRARPPRAPTRRTRDFPVGAAVRTDGRAPLRRRQRRERRLPAGPVRRGVGDRRAGRGRRRADRRGVVAAPSRELCTPCGGCRQRLREFAAADAPIHLADLERVRRTTTLAELLPLRSGRSTSRRDVPPTRSPSARPASRRGSG